MRRLWIAFTTVLVVAFAVLGWIGMRIYQEMPPIPDRVVTTDGRSCSSPATSRAGQNVWQSMGGMEVGSIWGHGSYVAPDWTADWLHREIASSSSTLGRRRARAARTRRSTPRAAGAPARARCALLMRTNTYDPATERSRRRRCARRRSRRTAGTTRDVFGNGRSDYAIPAGRRHRSGAAAAARAPSSSGRRGRRPPTGPATHVTYTSNWPHEPLVGNRPTGEAVVWTGVSIIMLLAGIGAMASGIRGAAAEPPARPRAPTTIRCSAGSPTPSQRATHQVLLGRGRPVPRCRSCWASITAHYGVEGDGFYGIPLSTTSCPTP